MSRREQVEYKKALEQAEGEVPDDEEEEEEDDNEEDFEEAEDDESDEEREFVEVRHAG